ncbi:hypothetical protein SM007_32660 [Streptomyces avermitilis]|nr:winged helix-turn-helix domain-containing protein [Streptomyces avermitilis]OOV21835.1 hypothetical protein SM007_32660 [Streptomyces avermitilis]
MSRIKTLIGRRLRGSYPVRGVAALHKRHGWTCQVPDRCAVERDEAAVAGGGRRPGQAWSYCGGRRSTHGSCLRTRTQEASDCSAQIVLPAWP